MVALINHGFDVGIVDDCSNTRPTVLNALERITGVTIPFGHFSIEETSKLNAWMQQNGPFHGVVHFAAFKSVGDSVINPLNYYRNNIQGLISLMETLEQQGIRYVVFSSSCSVYGNPEQLPVTESTPFQKAESPYALTKQVGEMVLHDMTKHKPWKVSLLRYFNPIGAHPSAEIGELPLGPPNNLVPVITQAVAGLRNPLTVHGTDYPTPDGTCIRDYIDVNDLGQAHTLALKQLFDSSASSLCTVYNLGTGKGSSVFDVIHAFEGAAGIPVPHTLGPRRPGDVVSIYANCDKSNNELGWKATTTLEESLLNAWKWQQRLLHKTT